MKIIIGTGFTAGPSWSTSSTASEPDTEAVANYIEALGIDGYKGRLLLQHASSFQQLESERRVDTVSNRAYTFAPASGGKFGGSSLRLSSSLHKTPLRYDLSGINNVEIAYAIIENPLPDNLQQEKGHFLIETTGGVLYEFQHTESNGWVAEKDGVPIALKGINNNQQAGWNKHFFRCWKSGNDFKFAVCDSSTSNLMIYTDSGAASGDDFSSINFLQARGLSGDFGYVDDMTLREGDAGDITAWDKIDPQTAGMLVIGQRYFIDNYVAGDDFTNVGASVNETGESFIATGTTPTVWTNGSALINTSFDFQPLIRYIGYIFDADNIQKTTNGTPDDWGFSSVGNYDDITDGDPDTKASALVAARQLGFEQLKSVEAVVLEAGYTISELMSIALIGQRVEDDNAEPMTLLLKNAANVYEEQRETQVGDKGSLNIFAPKGDASFDTDLGAPTKSTNGMLATVRRGV